MGKGKYRCKYCGKKIWFINSLFNQTCWLCDNARESVHIEDNMKKKKDRMEEHKQYVRDYENSTTK